MLELDWRELISRKRIEAVRDGDVACRSEWDGDDPESVLAELVADQASDAGMILGIGGRAVVANEGRAVALGLSASALPFADEVFDLICSAPLPGSPSAEAFAEAARVMKPGGALVGIVDGETHRIETQEVFGRGYQWPRVQPVRFSIPDLIAGAGLELGFFAEYYGVSYCPDTRSFAMELETLPIIPNLEPTKDAALLREVERKLRCERGIRNTEHAAVFAAWRHPDAG